MTSSSTPKPWAFACIAAAALALPAVAAAQTPSATGGGAQAPASAPATTPSLAAAPTGPDTLQAPSGGVIANQVAVIQGSLEPVDAGLAVALQQLSSKTGLWQTVASTTATADGNFTVHWRSKVAGLLSLRAVPADDAAQTKPADAATAQVPVLHSDVASWFGPGFYGHQTACGQMMTPQLVGVAHPSLPCGTLIALSYAGHEITVPVVDRGPYKTGVNLDLTTATAQELGVTETVRVGALAVG